jgi:non-ribosomal peptide synthetase component F
MKNNSTPITSLPPEQKAMWAVKTDGDAVTYAELNAMANRVAHAIIAERGDRPEPIGALRGKGVEQIAAMLGILKAGKFFILLDPSFPAERISLVIGDSKATLLFVDRRTLSLAQQDATAHCKLIPIDTLAKSIPAQDPKIPNSSGEEVGREGGRNHLN